MKEKEIKLLLNTTFHRHFGISDIDWGELAEDTVIVECNKNTYIRKAHQYERSLNYLLEGATGNFAYKKDKLVCVDLCFQGDFFGDYSSLILQQKSPLEIRALVQTKYFSIPFSKLLEFYAQQSPIVIEQIGRSSAEHLYVLKSKELLESKTLSARERYVDLLKNRPGIFQDISLKYIASYLGVTAESLSRIRRSLAKDEFLP